MLLLFQMQKKKGRKKKKKEKGRRGKEKRREKKRKKRKELEIWVNTMLYTGAKSTCYEPNICWYIAVLYLLWAQRLFLNEGIYQEFANYDLWVPVFITSYWNTAIHTHLCTAYVCFHAIIVKLSNSKRIHTAYET